METSLRELLDRVEVTEPVAVDGMQVFGLRWDADPGLTYTTMDDALEAGTLEITEIDESGSVPEIKVVNKGDTMIFLMAGEQLIGAMQNRVINASMMVPAKGDLVAPVSCVERGRWGYRSRAFRSTGSSSHSTLRRMMSRHAYEGYRTDGRPSSRQGEVWAEVDRKLDCMGSTSPSDALEQAYEDRAEKFQEVIKQARVPDGCHGVVFATGGRVAGVDLFDKASTLKKLLPKLVKAHALDTFAEAKEGKSLNPDAVREWLRRSKDAPSESFESPGVGRDVRIESDQVTGACLVVEERAVHLELFPEDGAERE